MQHKLFEFFICRAGIGIAILYFWQTLQTELKIYLQPFTLTLHKPCVSQAVSQAESAGSSLTGNPLPGIAWDGLEMGAGCVGLGAQRVDSVAAAA